MFKRGVLAAACVAAALAMGCGAGMDEQEGAGGEGWKQTLKSSQQEMHDGKCCIAHCTLLNYGSYGVTQNCADWAAMVCQHRGQSLWDAEWGTCGMINVNWIS